MKKSLFKNAAVVALISASALSFAPTQSQALVGVLIGNVPMICIGGGMMALGLIGAMADDDNPSLGMAFGTLGIVVLNDKGQVSPQFTALSVDQAKSIGISSDEMIAYNSELPQINSVYQTIVSDTEDQNQPGTSAKELSAFANQEWSTYGSQSLSSNAQSALTKVRANLAQQLN